MKKLMIAAAVAAMTAGAFAGNCNEPTTDDCQTVFTVKLSGKTATENKKGTYKTVQKIKASGQLVLNGEGVTETLKMNGDELELTDGVVTKFTIFGKNLADAENNIKKGKTYSFESDLGVKFENQGDAALNINQVAFGKAKVFITKGKTITPDCGEPTEIAGCIPVVTPGNYNGWFTGDFTPACLDETTYNDYCYEAEESTIALIGGTWSAKYSKKLSVQAEIPTEPTVEP